MHRLHPRKRIMQSITNTRSINWNYSGIVLMTCVHDLYEDLTGDGSDYMGDIYEMCDDIIEMYGKVKLFIIFKLFFFHTYKLIIFMKITTYI